MDLVDYERRSLRILMENLPMHPKHFWRIDWSNFLIDVVEMCREAGFSYLGVEVDEEAFRAKVGDYVWNKIRHVDSKNEYYKRRVAYDLVHSIYCVYGRRVELQLMVRI